MKNFLLILIIIGLLIWAIPFILMLILMAATAVGSIFEATPGWSFGILGIIVLLWLSMLLFRKK